MYRNECNHICCLAERIVLEVLYFSKLWRLESWFKKRLVFLDHPTCVLLVRSEEGLHSERWEGTEGHKDCLWSCAMWRLAHFALFSKTK